MKSKDACRLTFVFLILFSILTSTASYAADGDMKWALTTGDMVSSSPAIIYVGSCDGKLYAIKSSSGGLADTSWPMFHHDLKHTGQQDTGSTYSLIRKYEPILYLHYGEDYVPMNVGPYVEERCSLWYKKLDKQVIREGRVKLDFLGDPRITNWSDFYLWFDEESVPPASLPDVGPEWLGFDEIFQPYAEAALAEYNRITDKSVIYYGRQTVDGGYVVLQYWFFYAYNSWGAYEFGLNIHEGDWEMISIFLEPQGEELIPRYAAYSAHHDSGAKVRRSWDEVEKDGDHPIVYVALGSHAGYFDSGWHKEFPVKGLIDKTSTHGTHIGPGQGIEWAEPFILEDENLPLWIDKYNGRWGADWECDDHLHNPPLGWFVNGLSGPEGPKFQGDKWDHPAVWAGLATPIATGDVLYVYTPTAMQLQQNYPNPFNPDTWLPYQLTEDANVVVRIHDTSGRLVRSLDLGRKPAGFYITKGEAAYWDGKNEAGEEVASGIYFYTLQAGDFTATKKMIVGR